MVRARRLRLVHKQLIIGAHLVAFIRDSDTQNLFNQLFVEALAGLLHEVQFDFSRDVLASANLRHNHSRSYLLPALRNPFDYV